MSIVKKESDFSSLASESNVVKDVSDNSNWLSLVLSILYILIGLLTLIQLARIHFVLNINRWSMQKGFQAMNVIICLLRSVSLLFYGHLHDYTGRAASTFIIDFTSFFFFTTYTLVVLFWANIIYLAMPNQRHQCSPSTVYLAVNLAGYVAGSLFWSLCVADETIDAGRGGSAVLLALYDVLAAYVFIDYGFKLLKLLKISPARPSIRMNKMREISIVTGVAILCFVWKAAIEIFITFHKKGMTYSQDEFVDVMFYAFTEISVMATILALLSRLPAEDRSPEAESYYPTQDDSSITFERGSSTESPLIPSHSVYI